MSDDNRPNQIFSHTAIGALVMYLILGFFASFNIYLYIVKQKRYKSFLVITFYYLSITIIMARIALYSSVVHNVYNKEENDYYTYSDMSLVSTYSKVALGYSQMASMLELTLRLQLSLKKSSENNRHDQALCRVALKDDLNAKIRILYGCVVFMIAISAGICTLEIIDLNTDLKKADLDNNYTSEEIDEDIKVFGYATGALFALLSLGLLLTYIYLR